WLVLRDLLYQGRIWAFQACCHFSTWFGTVFSTSERMRDGTAAISVKVPRRGLSCVGLAGRGGRDSNLSVLPALSPLYRAHARIPVTPSPWTSVNRMSRPPKR